MPAVVICLELLMVQNFHQRPRCRSVSVDLMVMRHKLGVMHRMRCVQISWMAGGLYPEMPFNQAIDPCGTQAQGSRGRDIINTPAGHRTPCVAWQSRDVGSIRISPSKPFIADTRAKLFDLSFKVSRGSSKALYLMVRGQVLAFDWAKGCVKFERAGRTSSAW